MFPAPLSFFAGFAIGETSFISSFSKSAIINSGLLPNTELTSESKLFPADVTATLIRIPPFYFKYLIFYLQFSTYAHFLTFMILRHFSFFFAFKNKNGKI